MTTGRGISPASLPVRSGFEVRSIVPHDVVLPSVDLTITHAGLGTSMYSLGAGVPCLCLPNGRDQDENAARIAALGLGRVLPPSTASEEVRSVVVDMLIDKDLRAASRSFASRVERFGDLKLAADLVTGLASRRVQDGARPHGGPPR